MHGKDAFSDINIFSDDSCIDIEPASMLYSCSIIFKIKEMSKYKDGKMTLTLY